MHSAEFGEKSGWERVNWYARNEARRRRGAAARAAGPGGTGRRPSAPSTLRRRERVAVFDESSFSKMEIAGPGAAEFLERPVRQPTWRAASGKITYTQMLNRRGGIECDFTVARLAPERFLDRHRHRVRQP